MVLDRLRDGQVALEGEHDGHEDGGEDRDGLQLVEAVRERVHVQGAEGADVLPKEKGGKRETGVIRD